MSQPHTTSCDNHTPPPTKWSLPAKPQSPIRAPPSPAAHLISRGMPGDEQAPNRSPNPNPHRPQSTGAKRRRNLPGTPDPAAEVVALSPRTLTTASNYPCDVCGKDFRRHQNLQIHRRGHNLPWKLKASGDGSGEKEQRKRVYVCPVETCVFHNPSRALGDLTGIKKHYCRKHGERKWNCERCSKSYAVRTDWKAHSRICGSRHYECRCGIIFSRKESFVVHKASCGGEPAEGDDDGCGLSLSLAPTSELGLKGNAVGHELLFRNLWGEGTPPELEKKDGAAGGEHIEPVRAHLK